MLLIEILSKASPKIRTSKKTVSPFVPHKNHQVLGIGAQAIAYMHKKYPGKLIKTIQIYAKDDPQYQFARLCLNHQDNPYFPKIFGVKMFTSEDMHYQKREDQFGKISDKDLVLGEPAPSQLDYTLYMATERLKPINTINQSDLDRMGIVLPEVDPRLIAQWTAASNRYNRASVLEYHFRFCFEEPHLRQQLTNGVTDPQLKQAFRLMEPLFRHYRPDMHTGNIMLRGSQWVFVDPVTHDWEKD